MLLSISAFTCFVILSTINICNKGDTAIGVVCMVLSVIFLFTTFGAVKQYEDARGQAISSSFIQLNQNYAVLPQPSDVVWLQKKDSNIVTAFKFKGQHPPDTFIAIRMEDGKKVFVNPPVNAHYDRLTKLLKSDDTEKNK